MLHMYIYIYIYIDVYIYIYIYIDSLLYNDIAYHIIDLHGSWISSSQAAHSRLRLLVREKHAGQARGSNQS